MSLGAIAALGAGSSPPQRRPRLVVLLVVDQMRADYVDSYGESWNAGLRRLYDHSARFVSAAFPYSGTVTCAGHATIGTGTFPHRHGMVLNHWWDRELRKRRACTADTAYPAVSYGAAVAHRDAATSLRVPTLTDALRRTEPAGRVVVASVKSRAAIGLAGHGGDAVTWFDRDSGAWTTSSYYTRTPVPFVQAFVAAHPVQADLGRVWERMRPASAYRYEDDVADERPLWYATHHFPHVIEANGATPDKHFFEAWAGSPSSNDYLADLAIASVDTLRLGRADGVDFLGVSFSALDLVGHSFGPHSQEVQDLLLRLDVTLGRLLAHLDAAVGPDAYVVALTGDHGIAEIPEELSEAGLDAGRLEMKQVRAAVDRALSGIWGAGSYVASTEEGEVYLAAAVRERFAGDQAARSRVADAVRQIPGVEEVYASAELDRVEGSEGRRRAAALSHDPGRSGDLSVLPRNNWAVDDGDAATHGTAAPYDQHVPLLLYGFPFQAGEYAAAASPADLAPTLAKLAGVTLSGTEGRVLSEALR